MKLLLFDIDGTLVLTHGVGRRSVEEAFLHVLGHPLTTEGVSFSGKTDPQILHEVLARNGLPLHALNGRFEAVLETYCDLMRAAIADRGVQVLPGVHDLLGALSTRPDVRLALLTGNLEPMAYLKLEAAGLARYFSFGAFGSDNPDRYRLPAIAVERAQARTGHTFRGKDVIIIGDTEHDIACGRTLDVFSVGVCTGRFKRADLEPHGPDVLLDDLSDVDAFVRDVLRDA